jgi:hypothetical protein
MRMFERAACEADPGHLQAVLHLIAIAADALMA